MSPSHAGTKRWGNKLYRLFTGYFSGCMRALGTGCAGSAVSFHTTAAHINKGTWLRRIIFLRQRSIPFNGWETAGFMLWAVTKASWLHSSCTLILKTLSTHTGRRHTFPKESASADLELKKTGGSRLIEACVASFRWFNRRWDLDGISCHAGSMLLTN